MNRELFPLSKSSHSKPDAAESIKAIVASKAGQAKSLATEYIGLERSIAHAHEQICQLGPFDIFLGFSQGSVMITLLTMWYLKQQKPRPWKLNLLFCGHRAHGTNAQYLLHSVDGQRLVVPVPSIHRLGRNDPLYHEGKQLSAMYENGTEKAPKMKLVLYHDGEHRFPSQKQNPEVYDAILCAIELHFSYKVQRFVGARL